MHVWWVLSIATSSQNVYTLIFIFPWLIELQFAPALDASAISTLYTCFMLIHTLSLCSYSATLTLAFVNQIGITSFCQCAIDWERNIQLKFWLWIVSNWNFMYQCFPNWHVVFLFWQYEWKLNHMAVLTQGQSNVRATAPWGAFKSSSKRHNVAGSWLGNDSV